MVDMERTANIAFMVLLLVPVILVFGLMNLLLIRQWNLSRRRDKGSSEESSSGRAYRESNVRPLHSGKRRSPNRKKALFR